MGLSNFIGGAWWDVAQVVWKYFLCAFCMVLVGLSVYSSSMRSLWMGVRYNMLYTDVYNYTCDCL
jgi:hypothetical protein